MSSGNDEADRCSRCHRLTCSCGYNESSINSGPMTHPKGETREWPERVMLNTSAFANFSGAMAYKIGVSDEGKTEYISLQEHDALMKEKNDEMSAMCLREESDILHINKLKAEIERMNGELICGNTTCPASHEHRNVWCDHVVQPALREARAKAFEEAEQVVGHALVNKFKDWESVCNKIAELAAKEREGN